MKSTFSEYVRRVRRTEFLKPLRVSVRARFGARHTRQVANHLNDKVNEPKQLIVHAKALVMVTVNLESEQLSQGQVQVVHDVARGDSVTI